MKEEQQLISQAKAGDLQAFQHLVELYSRKMYRLAYRILNHKEAAEDCVQEVFIKIYHKLASFNQTSKFSTWIYRVTVNAAIDCQRKNVRHNQHDDEQDIELIATSSGNSPERAIWLENVSETTHKAISQLAEEVRVAFLLRHYQECSIEEISQILEINPNTVKNRIFRGVARLREILQPKVGDYEILD